MNDQIDIYPAQTDSKSYNIPVYVVLITYAGNRTKVQVRGLPVAWAYADGFNRALQMLKLSQVPIFEHDLSKRDHDIKTTCNACEERKLMRAWGEVN